MSVEQVHIQGDIAQVLTEVDIDVLRGVAVGDVAGMADSSLAEAGVPAHVEPGKQIRFSHGVIRCAGVQVNIHTAFVIPVDKKPYSPCFFRDPPGETAADVCAVLRFVRGLHQGMGEVEGTGIQPHLPAFKRRRDGLQVCLEDPFEDPFPRGNGVQGADAPFKPGGGLYLLGGFFLLNGYKGGGCRSPEKSVLFLDPCQPFPVGSLQFLHLSGTGFAQGEGLSTCPLPEQIIFFYDIRFNLLYFVFGECHLHVSVDFSLDSRQFFLHPPLVRFQRGNQALRVFRAPAGSLSAVLIGADGAFQKQDSLLYFPDALFERQRPVFLTLQKNAGLLLQFLHDF